MISRLIKKNRNLLEVELRQKGYRRLFSPTLLALERALIPRLRDHAHGKFLDLGCGAMPFRRHVEPQIESY